MTNQTNQTPLVPPPANAAPVAVLGNQGAATTGSIPTNSTTSINQNISNSNESIDSWKKWFDSRDSSTFINKQAQEELFQAFNSSLSADECKRKLLENVW